MSTQTRAELEEFTSPMGRPRPRYASDLLKQIWLCSTRCCRGLPLFAYQVVADGLIEIRCLGLSETGKRIHSEPLQHGIGFDTTRKAMAELAAAATDARERERWTKMELALLLAEATGRRLGSIRALRWEDIDFGAGRIRWRAEADKKGVEWVIPIPQSLVEDLRVMQRRIGALGGLLFASQPNADQPMDRHLFDKWLAAAEVRAQIPKLKGALRHAYRRKWASERKHLSLVDVAAAGGWKDTATLLESYMQPDTATLLQVMSEPKKLHDAGAG